MHPKRGNALLEEANRSNRVTEIRPRAELAVRLDEWPQTSGLHLIESLPFVERKKPRRKQQSNVGQQRETDERDARQRRPAIDEVADG
jgi:hypothetical protein